MHNYLIIFFNRYDTEQSTHTTIEADTPLNAIYKNDSDIDKDGKDWIRDEYIQVDSVFGCVPGEESDILIYKQ